MKFLRYERGIKTVGSFHIFVFFSKYDNVFREIKSFFLGKSNLLYQIIVFHVYIICLCVTFNIVSVTDIFNIYIYIFNVYIYSSFIQKNTKITYAHYDNNFSSANIRKLCIMYGDNKINFEKVRYSLYINRWSFKRFVLIKKTLLRCHLISKSI